MVLKLCIIFLLISISIKAHPSKLKILPGLAFYRTDEGHDDSDSKLIEKDKDLLRSMWNIVDKMDDKTEGESLLQRSLQHPPPSDNKFLSDPAEQHPGSVKDATLLQASLCRPQSALSNSVPEVMKGMMRKVPPIGNPITTINVFSAYPAVPPKSDPQYTASYHHVPAQYGNSYGVTSYSTNDIKPASRFTNLGQNPNYDSSKSKMFEPISPNNPVGYDQRNVKVLDNILSHSQYDSILNSKIGTAYDAPITNHDENVYNSASNSANLIQYEGLDNTADSSPQQFLMPDNMSSMRSMGSVGSFGSLGSMSTMKSIRAMGEMNMNYPEMNMDNLRSNTPY